MKRFLAVGAMGGVALAYALVPIVLHFALGAGLGVAALIVAQFLLSLVMILGWSSVRRQSWVPPRQSWTVLGLLGVSIVLTDIAYYQSLARLPVASAVLLLFQFPWMAMGIEAIWNRQWPSWRGWALAAGMWGGTVLALHPGHLHVGLGLIWGVMAGVGYAVTLVLAARIPTGLSTAERLVLPTLAGLVLAIGFYWATGPSAPGWPIALFGPALALDGFLIPTALLVTVGSHVGGAGGALLAAGELPLAVGLAVLVLGQSVAPTQWIGVGIVVLVIILAARAANPPRPP